MSKEFVICLIVVIITIAAFCYFGYFYKKGKYKAFANKILLNLVCEAELQFGAKTGDIKNSYVFRTLYESMPAAFRLFVTQTDVLLMIESALDEFEEYLAVNSDAKISLGLDLDNTEAIDTYDNVEGESDND